MFKVKMDGFAEWNIFLFKGASGILECRSKTRHLAVTLTRFLFVRLGFPTQESVNWLQGNWIHYYPGEKKNKKTTYIWSPLASTIDFFLKKKKGIWGEWVRTQEFPPPPSFLLSCKLILWERKKSQGLNFPCHSTLHFCLLVFMKASPSMLAKAE